VPCRVQTRKLLLFATNKQTLVRIASLPYKKGCAHLSRLLLETGSGRVRHAVTKLQLTPVLAKPTFPNGAQPI